MSNFSDIVRPFEVFDALLRGDATGLALPVTGPHTVANLLAGAGGAPSAVGNAGRIALVSNDVTACIIAVSDGITWYRAMGDGVISATGNVRGEVTLVAGSSGAIAVAEGLATSHYNITRTVTGGVLGFLTVVAGAGTITINSSNAGDTSTVRWALDRK